MNTAMKSLKGFTLTELIVVLGIVALSSTIVLFNYRGSRQATTLSATALEVANMIRIAQTGGRTGAQGNTDFTSTQGELQLLDPTNSGSEKTRSGIHFALTSSQISTMTVYRGQDSSFGYNSATDIKLEEKRFSTGVVVARICTGSYDFSQQQDCNAHNLSDISIEFSRLTSDPYYSSSYVQANSSMSSMIIQLESELGGNSLYRYVVVEPTGNIYVR